MNDLSYTPRWLVTPTLLIIGCGYAFISSEAHGTFGQMLIQSFGAALNTAALCYWIVDPQGEM